MDDQFSQSAAWDVGRMVPGMQSVADEFSRLPGIGPKTASRLAYYLLRQLPEQSRALAAALAQLHERVQLCSTCFNVTDASAVQCPLCRDETRDAGLICVVEAPLDVFAIERARAFNGRYHVLHGAISPLDDIGPDDLRIAELLARLGNARVREIILATNPSYEGEATAAYLEKQIGPLGIKVTRLGRGLPIGGDLEYAAASTLAHALEIRQ